MPGQKLNGALLSLFLQNETPWNFPRWQELTGVYHGLFPDDDSLLPAGLTRSDVDSIKSYISQYSAVVGEDARIKFSSGRRKQARIVGRDLWNAFTNNLWKKAKLHDLVVKGLGEAGAHPIQVMVNNKLDTFPSASLYVPLAVDDVGIALFGPEAVDKGNHVFAYIRGPLQAIIMRSWDALKPQVSKAKQNLPRLEEKAVAAILALNDKKFTAHKLQIAIKAVASFHMAAHLVGLPIEQDRADELKAEIDALFNRADVPATSTVKGKKTVEARGLCKLTRDNLSKLATALDIADLEALYTQFFSDIEDGDGVYDREMHDPSILESLKGIDLGMEEEIAMSPDDLSEELGYVDNLPFLFNCFRHKTGLNPWDSPNAFNPKSSSYQKLDLAPVSLHWHQLAGVRATLRKVFSNEDAADHCRGMLIADEVGLGKTPMIIAIIATISHFVWLQEHNMPVPSILQQFPYLLGSKVIPSDPHLIIVPTTLHTQWEKEIKTFLKPHKVDVLSYHSDHVARTQFWAHDGPFQQSKHRRHQIIILATETALQYDFKMVYSSKVDMYGAPPWQLPPEMANSSTQNTLYSQKFLTVTMDEAQHFKNVGIRYYSALRLRDQARISLACTATPLQTAPKDVANIGRLVGVEFFSTDIHVAQAKEDNVRLGKAKRDDAEVKNANCVAREQILIAQRLQQDFDGHILRRTNTSKGWDGKVLIDLLPLVTIEGFLKLSDPEMEIITEHAENAKVNVSSSNGTCNPFPSTSFYSEYRMSFTYAKLDRKTPLPVFNTIQDWEASKSTKLDAFVRICQHYLSRDDAPHVSFEGGQLVIPEMPPIQQGKVITRDRRICAFLEFVHFRSLIMQVLLLYGIEFLWLDGKTPTEKREGIIRRLYTQGQPRLLIFSTVGAAGVNMAIADVMIHLDVVWSAQDMRQINGRVHRQPQSKAVHAIHLIAQDTSDVIMYSMAKGKQNMLETFANRDSGEELLELLSGNVLQPGVQDDENEDDDLSKKPRRRKSKKVEVETDQLKSMAMSKAQAVSKETETEVSKPKKGSRKVRTSCKVVQPVEHNAGEEKGGSITGQVGGRDASPVDDVMLSTAEGLLCQSLDGGSEPPVTTDEEQVDETTINDRDLSSRSSIDISENDIDYDSRYMDVDGGEYYNDFNDLHKNPNPYTRGMPSQQSRQLTYTSKARLEANINGVDDSSSEGSPDYKRAKVGGSPIRPTKASAVLNKYQGTKQTSGDPFTALPSHSQSSLNLGANKTYLKTISSKPDRTLNLDTAELSIPSSSKASVHVKQKGLTKPQAQRDMDPPRLDLSKLQRKAKRPSSTTASDTGSNSCQAEGSQSSSLNISQPGASTSHGRLSATSSQAGSSCDSSPTLQQASSSQWDRQPTRMGGSRTGRPPANATRNEPKFRARKPE